MQNFKQKKLKAFTLTELAIVLVIIGLIIGGVTTGSSLIKQSQVRSVIYDITNFKNSINAFKLQYGQLPGDFNNATALFGGGTANGNGDEHILYSGGPNANESLRMWQHLDLAGILPGNYTGVGGGTGNEADIGTNTPPSKLNNGGYYIDYGTFNGYSTSANILYFGAFTANSQCNSSVISANYAYNIDLKMDDGQPMNGVVHGFHPTLGTPNCRSSNTAYNISDQTTKCQMSFMIN